jgi:beta-glucosidase
MEDALFPFGFGLSFTRFDIGNATCSKTSLRNNEAVQLTVPVTNTGRKAGTEVVQVYVHKVNDAGGTVKTLRAFQRVELAAGETKTVTLDMPPATFEFYDAVQRKMAVMAGDYEVFYGNSSAVRDLKVVRVNVLNE